jgi:hypothetical protein
MLTAAILVKLIAEIALLALVAQAVVGVMAGAGKANNPVYRLLQLVGKPWVKAARWVSPRVVLDRHVPFVAFFGLLVLWCAAVVAKVGICLQIGVALCK